MRLANLVRTAGSAAALGLVLFWWWNLSGTFGPLPKHVTTEAGEFTLGPEPPIARTEAGGVVCDGAFYLVGGIGPLAETYASTVRFDPASRVWTTLADLPRPINHPGVACLDGRVHVVGGFGPLGLRPRGFMLARWDPLDTTYVYDAPARRWRTGPLLPEPRGAGGIAVSGGALYYVGGIGPARTDTSDLFRLRSGASGWESLTPMATARDHLRLESIGPFLFALSGRRDDLRFNLPDVERYDVVHDRWQPAAPIPVARGGLGSTVLGGRIYTFGGEFPWSCHAGMESYDPSADAWRKEADLPEARHGIQAGVLEGRLHLISGGRHPRVSVSAIHRIFTPGR